jgi:hypothetical protein
MIGAVSLLSPFSDELEIICNVTITNSIDDPIDRDYLRFSVIDNEIVSLSLIKSAPSDGSFNPVARLLRGDGTAVAGSCGTFSLGNTTELLDCGPLPATGNPYRLEVVDRFFDGSGTYRASVNFLTSGCPPCGPITLSQSSQSFTPDAGAGSVNIIAQQPCNWTATSNAGFINITSDVGGSGSGTVSYSVDENFGASPRSGTMTIAGRIFIVYQGVRFNDVLPSHTFYELIGKLSAHGITTGCGNGNFCPEDPVTREQMAAFIIRALGQFNPPAPISQRFGDVPPSNFFYSFINEMAIRQITLGCGGGNYCPTDTVTREQMAAFIIRALGTFSPPVPASQRFSDVPPSNFFYNFIDRMAVLGITLGCGPNIYCPTDPVTRGQMAAFLVRAFGL